MQIQQLRYLITAAQCGSIRAAAQKLFVSQSAVSTAVKDLEREMGIRIFDRTSRGITLTRSGMDFLSYAQRIIDQVDLMQTHYANDPHEETAHFSVSSLHDLLVTRAFGNLIDAHSEEACDFSLRESNINAVINDVEEQRCDLGIIYLSNFTDQVIRHTLESRDLSFSSLYSASPSVVLGDRHPLAGKDRIQPEELAPYDRYELEQGIESSSYYADEPLSAMPHRRKITLGDNSSLAAILAEHDGYSIVVGTSPANRSLSLVPLDTEELMNIGYIVRKDAKTTSIMREFLALLGRQVLENEGKINPADAVFYFTRMRKGNRTAARDAE